MNLNFHTLLWSLAATGWLYFSKEMLISNPYDSPPDCPPPTGSQGDGWQRNIAILQRITRILWLAPIVLLVPTLIVVRKMTPVLNHGSIGDGFRILNVFFSGMLPITFGCWGVALLMTALMEIRSIPRSRLLMWFAAIVFLITIVVVLVVSNR